MSAAEIDMLANRLARAMRDAFHEDITTGHSVDPNRCWQCGLAVKTALGVIASIPSPSTDDVCWCDGPDCGQRPCVEASGATS